MEPYMPLMPWGQKPFITGNSSGLRRRLFLEGSTVCRFALTRIFGASLKDFSSREMESERNKWKQSRALPFWIICKEILFILKVPGAFIKT